MMKINRSSWILLLAALSGCSFAPGMHTTDLQRGKRSVVVQDEQNIPSEDAIQEINADLIVRLQSSFGRTPIVESFNETTSFDPLATSQVNNTLTGSSTNASRYNNPQLENGRFIQPGHSVDDYMYRVGPADILSIIVWEHQELTIPAGAERSAEQAGTVVENDGTIYFPYAGVMQVAGMTLPEIRDMLTQKLDRYIEDVKLDVRMAQYNNKRVYVVGEVQQPSVQAITNVPPTLVEMINAAGGFTENANMQNLTLTRNDKNYRVDLLALYEHGDISQNIMLQPGDVINVADRETTKLYVLGEVTQPGSYYVHKGDMSLAEALSDAGGVNPNTSNPGQIFVFRSHADKPAEVFHLDARSPDALILADKFPLQPRDLVYVDAASVVRWSRIIQNISGTFSTLNQASQTDFPLFRGNTL